MATIEQITALVRGIQAPKLEPYYGRNNEDLIQWLNKLQVQKDNENGRRQRSIN